MANALTRGSVFKSLISFSLPFMFSAFLQTLYGMADLFVVGKFNPAEVINAVSIGSQVMHMVTVMILGLSMGTAVLVGRSYGSGDTKKSSVIIGNSVSLFVFVSIVITIVLVLFCPQIVSLMQTPKEALLQTQIYLLVCFSGIPFVTAYNVIASIFRGLGDSKRPMYFVITSCFVNIFLDFVFVGIFDMKAGGAALATVISQGFSVLLSITFWKKINSELSISKGELIPRKKVISSILKIGLPIACQDGFIQISFLVITIIANLRGVSISTAVGVVEKVICFLFLVPSSMLSAISALASQNIGAGEHKRAEKALWYGIMFSTSFGVFFAVLFQFISTEAVSIFTTDEKVIYFGTQYLKAYVIDCIFAAVHFCFSGFFCAYGYSMVSFIHNIISIVLIRIPGAALASCFYPETLYPMGLAAPAGSLLSAIICVGVFAYLKRSKNL